MKINIFFIVSLSEYYSHLLIKTILAYLNCTKITLSVTVSLKKYFILFLVYFIVSLLYYFILNIFYF